MEKPKASATAAVGVCVYLAWLSSVDAYAADSYGCLIEPMVVTSVGTQVQGVVDELLVDRSDRVERGQPLVRLDSSIETINLEQAEARVHMNSELNARIADRRLAKLQMQRVGDLHRQKMVSSAERDEAVAQFEMADASVHQAEENLALLEMEARRARQLLSQRTLRSPIDGVVVEQQVFPGEFVYDNPVMTIAQLDPLRVEVLLPSSRFGEFKPGDEALVIPELESDEPLEATVDVVDPLLDPRSGTFGARLLLPNPDLQITSGQQCELQFRVPETHLADHHP